MAAVSKLSGNAPVFVPRPKIPTGPKDPNRPRNPFKDSTSGAHKYSSEMAERGNGRKSTFAVDSNGSPGYRGEKNTSYQRYTSAGPSTSLDYYDNSFTNSSLQRGQGTHQVYRSTRDRRYNADGHYDHNSMVSNPPRGHRNNLYPRSEVAEAAERFISESYYNQNFSVQSPPRGRATNQLSYWPTAADQPIPKDYYNHNFMATTRYHSPPNRHSSSSKAPSLDPMSRTTVSIIRADTTRRDLIVSINGVYRNAIQLTERYDAEGQLSQEADDIFHPHDYNFFHHFASMSEPDKEEFLENNSVEVEINIPAGYDSHVESDEEQENTTGTTQAILSVKGKGKEIEVYERTSVIDTLNELGDSFMGNVKKLTIHLVFPTDPSQSPANSTINLKSGAPVHSPGYRFLEEFTHYMDAHFISLTRLTILLFVSSNVRMPLTLPQLYNALPFYDLRFKAWDLKYQPDNMTVQIKVSGWSMEELDRERERVVRERIKKQAEAKKAAEEEKKSEEEAKKEGEAKKKEGEAKKKNEEDAVFVRKSALLGDIDLRKLKKGESIYDRKEREAAEAAARAGR